MNKSNYTYLLANPQKISAVDLVGLNSIIQNYPYFQSARALLLKCLKNQDSYLYNDALKITAAYTTDRDILFEYITSEKFIQNEISQEILQHDSSVFEIEVASENISNQITQENKEKDSVELQKAEAILNPKLFERKVESIIEIAEEKQEVETQLEIDKPLEFTNKDTHSFSEWLQLAKVKPIDRPVISSEEISKEVVSSEIIPSEEKLEEEVNEEKDRKLDLIDKFILDKPKISPAGSTTSKTDINENITAAPDFSQDSSSLMTETLAKVYLQQKNYKKAIQAYKILILKNPEKSGFFADQIRAIEKLINT